MAICSIEGCGIKVKARGWCKLHYQHWQRKNKKPITKVKNPCSVQGCGLSVKDNYLCKDHLLRLSIIKQICLLLN